MGPDKVKDSEKGGQVTMWDEERKDALARESAPLPTTRPKSKDTATLGTVSSFLPWILRQEEQDLTTTFTPLPLRHQHRSARP